jgi:predicted translin family RNA/ssDNA-binding protein
MMIRYFNENFMKVRLPAKAFKTFEQSRRKSLRMSDDLRIESKSAIGWLLKDDFKKAKDHLKTAAKIYKDLKKLLKGTPYLYSVGGVHIGTEEYVEAQLLADYLDGIALSSLKVLDVNHQDYICGLCDMSGELLRYARKHPSRMTKIQEDVQSLYQLCLEMVVTRNGAIRKKLEDLERNERRMEEMIFQWDLKHA